MKITRVICGMAVVGLTVGLSTFALGEEDQTQRLSELLSTQPEEKTAEEKQAQRRLALVRVVDDQLVPSSKPSEPLYQPPSRGAPGGRVGGGTRGPSELPALYALVPDHVALTAEEQPQLVWYLSKATSYPLEFTVVERDGVEPLLEVPLPSPLEPGVQILSLTEYDLKFEPGKTYQWFVSLVPDAAHRSQDIVAGGTLEMAQLPGGMAENVRQANPLDATKLFAKAGFWYDAMATISQSIQENPTRSELHDIRATLLEQVKLHTVAQTDRQRGL